MEGFLTVLSASQFFELLGFDRFELIKELLENRKKLISSAFDSASEYVLNAKPETGKADGFIF